MSAFDEASKTSVPDYTYTDKMKPPGKIGVSDWPSITQMTPNIDGLLGYVKFIVEGGGLTATHGEDPLGPRFFLKTAGMCKIAKEGGYEDGEDIPKTERYASVVFDILRVFIPKTGVEPEWKIQFTTEPEST